MDSLIVLSRVPNAVASIQYDSVRKGTDKLTLSEIDAEIKDARSKRQKRVKKLYAILKKEGVS